MGRYHIPGNVAVLSTAFKTAAQAYATSGAAKRGFVMGLDLSLIGAPVAVDCQVLWDLPRLTTPSTSATSFTPNDLSGGADGACNATAGIASSTEPTVTANSQVFGPRGLNQRNSFFWETDNRLAALIWPATTNNGFALRAMNGTSGSYTGQVNGNVKFEE